MHSLAALKKLFRSKKDKESDSNNKGSRPKRASGAKKRIASFTSTFRSRTSQYVPVPANSQSDVVFRSQIADIVPLPRIPQVSSTLRREFARFKPLPLVHGDDSDDNSESASCNHTTNVTSAERTAPVETYTIRRKPVSSGFVCDDRAAATASPLADLTIRRKPVPVGSIVNDDSGPSRAHKDVEQTAAAGGVFAAHRGPIAELIASQQDSPSASIATSNAAASEPGSNSLSSPASRVISLSEFPIPPRLPRPEQTSPLAIYQTGVSVDIARRAVYEAPTAVDAQQALLDFVDVSATNTTNTERDDMSNGHSRDLSGDTVVTTYTAPIRDDWAPVETECAELTQMVSGFRLRRFARDIKGQNDMIRDLQSDKAKALAKNQVLAGDLAEANTTIKLERAKNEQHLRAIAQHQQERERLYKEKAGLLEDRDFARSVAEKMEAAAAKSDEADRELVCKIATNEYHVGQAKIVLENHRRLLKETGRTGEGWHNAAMEKDRENRELHLQKEHLDSVVGELTAQLTETAQLLSRTTRAIKLSETEAWTHKHLHEEAGRALALSQSMHKEANERAGDLQLQLSTQELEIKVERQCVERLLGDAMQANAAKDNRIAQFHDSLSSYPGNEATLIRQLDEAKQQFSGSEERIIAAQRNAEDRSELLTAEQEKCAVLTQEKQELANEVGQFKFELDIARDEKDSLQKQLSELQGDLNVTAENARLWQLLAEQNLEELSSDEQAQAEAYVLRELRKQLDQASSEATYYKERNQTVREDALDLEYELQLHQRRLAYDASSELGFYQAHWEQVEETFDSNRLYRATIEAFEERFAAELEREPLQLTRDPFPQKVFDGPPGPDHIAQSIALFKGQGGSDHPERPFHTERIQGIYGFGPAGPPEQRPSVEMPAGYLERKALRQGLVEHCELEGQCKDQGEGELGHKAEAASEGEGEWEDCEEQYWNENCGLYRGVGVIDCIRQTGV